MPSFWRMFRRIYGRPNHPERAQTRCPTIIISRSNGLGVGTVKRKQSFRRNKKQTESLFWVIHFVMELPVQVQPKVSERPVSDLCYKDEKGKNEKAANHTVRAEEIQWMWKRSFPQIINAKASELSLEDWKKRLTLDCGEEEAAEILKSFATSEYKQYLPGQSFQALLVSNDSKNGGSTWMARSVFSLERVSFLASTVLFFCYSSFFDVHLLKASWRNQKDHKQETEDLVLNAFQGFANHLGRVTSYRFVFATDTAANFIFFFAEHLQSLRNSLKTLRTTTAFGQVEGWIPKECMKGRMTEHNRLKTDAKTLEDIIVSKGAGLVLYARLYIGLRLLQYDPSLSLHDDGETAVCIAGGYVSSNKKVPLLSFLVWCLLLSLQLSIEL